MSPREDWGCYYKAKRRYISSESQQSQPEYKKTPRSLSKQLWWTCCFALSEWIFLPTHFLHFFSSVSLILCFSTAIQVLGVHSFSPEVTGPWVVHPLPLFRAASYHPPHSTTPTLVSSSLCVLYAELLASTPGLAACTAAYNCVPLGTLYNLSASFHAQNHA